MVASQNGPWVLALDVGTSSTRAIVFDSNGRALPDLRHQETYTPDADQPGQATFDADFLAERAEGCIDAVLTRAGAAASRIAAVGATTFWHSMVGISGDGLAATPLYTWADTRSADDAETLKDRLDPVAYHARTGCAVHPSYYPARLEWLKRTQPGLLQHVACWVSPGEYLFRRFFGAAGCSVSMASATGLFDQNGCVWDGKTLSALDLPPERLPALTDIDQPATGLVPKYADRWPALSRIPWVPAIGDGAASNVGSGCATARRMAINLGTSGAIRVLCPAGRIQIPEDLWCYRLDSRRYVLGGAFSDGGDAAVWMRDTLNLRDWQQSLAAVEAIPPDSHGLTFLPFLAGERSVGWRPHARATLHGLTSNTTPVEILRASMEAVALRFALVYKTLHERFPYANEIVAAGGGFQRAPFWAQIVADALGAPLLLSEETEATSRGAAAVALAAAGLLNDVTDLPTPATRRIEPDPDRHSVYTDALARQQALYSALARL